jgi:hypothetical protein
MDHRGEDEPPDTRLSRRLHHRLADIHLFWKKCRRDVKNTVHAIERGANIRLITKIAYRDFGRTALAHGIDLIFIFYHAANRGATPGELWYHESRELAGRAYRQDFGSVAHRALIPHQSRGKLINGQPPEAGSEITQWLAKSKVFRPRAVSRSRNLGYFSIDYAVKSQDEFCDQRF